MVWGFRFQWMGWRRFIRDFLLIQFGFLLFGVAINMMVQANLGLGPWDVLHMALTFHLPITLGEASIGVAFVVVLLDLFLREPIGWGTLANMVFIGVWIDLMKPLIPPVPGVLWIQMAYLLAGTIVMGFGTAVYIGVNAGAGPRDSLMLAVARLRKTSVRVARTVIEVTAVVVGWLLGGPAWIGTVVFALSIGPSVQLAFKILGIHTAQMEYTISRSRPRQS
jgi:uncharacterized membrane protein YczE